MSPENARPLIHVVAAALIDAPGRVLIAQRLAGKHLAGGWEFPGGKLEPGEERVPGLTRELHEELGITIRTPRPLMRVRHAYPAREVLLEVWVVRHYGGIPRGLDGQALRWCTRDELATVALLPADGPIVRTLWLPERLTHKSAAEYDVRIFGSGGFSGRPEAISNHLQLLGAACRNAAEAAAAAAAGADFLVLRERLTAAELAALCGAVTLPVYARGIPLGEAWMLGATGVNEIEDRGATDFRQNTV